MIIKDIHPLMEYLAHHPYVGELFAFIVAFAESLPLIGTIIPGTITMTAVGFLIGTGALSGSMTLFIVSFAALLGDTIGFMIGYLYNERLRSVWPFKKHPNWLSLGESFFHKHGGKSILIGRFVGPARSTIPLIAGLLQLYWVRFFIAAIPSAVLWAIVYTFPGIVLGALSREIPHSEMTKFLLYGIGIFAFVWLIFWLIQHFFLQLARAINRSTDRLWRYLSTHKKSHWFIRMIKNRQNPADHHQLTLFAFGFLSAILFLILLINVRFHTFITAWNIPVFHLLQSIHTPTLTNSMIVVSIMGSPTTITLLGILMTVGLLLKKQWRAATHLLIALILAIGAVFVFKSLSHSPRPTGFYIIAHSSSFPSGHTVLSFVIISFFTFMIAELLSQKSRWIPYTLATLFIALVGFSRLYLGAHWLTDIIGSVLLSIPIFFVCVISYHRMPKAISRLSLSPLSLSVLIILGFGIAWGTQIPRSFAQDQKRYVRIWPAISITQETWWNAPLQYTPTYRNNRLGNPYQPFNVQWLDSITAIKQILENANWKLVSRHDHLQNALKRFASYNPEDHMPLLPWLYLGKPPVLFMIKHIPNHRMILELRLWASNVVVQNSKYTLWLGAEDVRIPPKMLLSIKHRAKISLARQGNLKQLVQDTPQLQHKIIHAKEINEQRMKALSWNGNVLVIAKR